MCITFILLFLFLMILLIVFHGKECDIEKPKKEITEESKECQLCKV